MCDLCRADGNYFHTPECVYNTLKAGIFYTWPYGWELADFTPMMRRIFRGKRTRHVMLFDELPQLFSKLG